MGYFMKTTSILLVALLVLIMMFGFVGCQPVADNGDSSASASPSDGNISDGDVAEPEVFTFKLMSFNMRVQVGKTSDKRVEYDTVPDRAPLILKHIADADPDVICVQEWTGSHIIHVQPHLEETYEILSFDRGDFECTAILFKKDRFELVETEMFWLSETPDTPSKGWDAAYPRIYSSALLRDKKDGKVFRAGTTHIEANENTAKGRQRKMVVDHTANSKEPALVCGDFNFDATHALYLYCINTLNDCRTLVPNATTTASYNGYNLDGTALDSEGNVKNGYGYPIDQIFVKRNSFTVHSYKVLNYLIDGKFSSDHYPLVVELSIN